MTVTRGAAVRVRAVGVVPFLRALKPGQRPGALKPGLPGTQPDLAERVRGKRIVTIEGNAGNRCRRMVRDAKFIVGYGRPAYGK